jgi:hypothetical protein
VVAQEDPQQVFVGGQIEAKPGHAQARLQQRKEGDLLTCGHQLSRHLEGHDAAERPTA